MNAVIRFPNANIDTSLDATLQWKDFAKIHLKGSVHTVNWYLNWVNASIKFLDGPILQRSFIAFIYH